MMDVSDGLLLDASRMARASGVTFAIDSLAVPLAAPESRRADALRWGDDYQLLFTLPDGKEPPVEAYRIGEAVQSAQAPVLLDGQPLSEECGLGYEHS
jgi:thiamine-monophosphate kinase